MLKRANGVRSDMPGYAGAVRTVAWECLDETHPICSYGGRSTSDGLLEDGRGVGCEQPGTDHSGQNWSAGAEHLNQLRRQRHLHDLPFRRGERCDYPARADCLHTQHGSNMRKLPWTRKSSCRLGGRPNQNLSIYDGFRKTSQCDMPPVPRSSTPQLCPFRTCEGGLKLYQLP